MTRKIMVIETGMSLGNGRHKKRWLLCEHFENGAVVLREWWGDEGDIWNEARISKCQVWAIELKRKTENIQVGWEPLAEKLGDTLTTIENDDTAEEKKHTQAKDAIEEVLCRDGRRTGASPNAVWGRYTKDGRQKQAIEDSQHSRPIALQCLFGRKGEVWTRCAGRWITGKPQDEDTIDAAWVFMHASVNPEGFDRVVATLEAMAIEISTTREDPKEKRRIEKTEDILKGWGTLLDAQENHGWTRLEIKTKRKEENSGRGKCFRIMFLRVLAMTFLITVVWQAVDNEKKSKELGNWTLTAEYEDDGWSCESVQKTTLERVLDAIAEENTSNDEDRVMIDMTSVQILENELHELRGWISPATGWMEIENDGGKNLYQVDMEGVQPCKKTQ